MGAGHVANTDGVAFQHERFTTIRKNWKKGEQIAKHNHPEAQVVFTVVTGAVNVHLNDDEHYELTPGTFFQFDGNNFISGDILEDTIANVTLIKK